MQLYMKKIIFWHIYKTKWWNFN